MRKSKQAQDGICNLNMVTNRASYNPQRISSHCLLNCSISSLNASLRQSRFSSPAQSLHLEDLLKQTSKTRQNNIDSNQNTVKVKGFFVEEESPRKDEAENKFGSKQRKTLESKTILCNIAKNRSYNESEGYRKENLLVPLIQRPLRQLVIDEVNSQQSDIDTYARIQRKDFFAEQTSDQQLDRHIE